MKCVRTAIKADVIKYEIGQQLEDGFERYADVITESYVDCENLVEIEKDGVIMCPYIKTRRGKTFIKSEDYVVIEEDGTKVVCGADKIQTRYTEIKE